MLSEQLRWKASSFGQTTSQYTQRILHWPSTPNTSTRMRGTSASPSWSARESNKTVFWDFNRLFSHRNTAQIKKKKYRSQCSLATRTTKMLHVERSPRERNNTHIARLPHTNRNMRHRINLSQSLLKVASAQLGDLTHPAPCISSKAIHTSTLIPLQSSWKHALWAHVPLSLIPLSPWHICSFFFFFCLCSISKATRNDDSSGIMWNKNKADFRSGYTVIHPTAIHAMFKWTRVRWCSPRSAFTSRVKFLPPQLFTAMTVAWQI